MSNSNYPPGVTGNEPQICGTGLEGKCDRCIDRADYDLPFSSIPDGVIELDGEWLCEDCRAEEHAPNGENID